MNKLIIAAIAAVGVMALTGCRHKDLIFEDLSEREVDIVFDWRNAPDADPASMEAVMYRTDGADYYRYILPGRDGGRVNIASGGYMGLATNSDNIDWAVIKHKEDPDNFETQTRDATMLSASQIKLHSLPRAQGTEEERIAMGPGMMWNARRDEVTIKEAHGITRVVFYPSEAVCHYTVDIYDVKNISALAGSQLDATLSGMAEGFLHNKGTATDNVVTMPFTLDSNSKENSLHGEFLTFGETPSGTHPHIMTVYALLDDGSKRYYAFDVTKQVSDAADPKHVHIVVRGLEIPETVHGGGGLLPTVDDWQETDIDLDMGT